MLIMFPRLTLLTRGGVGWARCVWRSGSMNDADAMIFRVADENGSVCSYKNSARPHGIFVATDGAIFIGIFVATDENGSVGSYKNSVRPRELAFAGIALRVVAALSRAGD